MTCTRHPAYDPALSPRYPWHKNCPRCQKAREAYLLGKRQEKLDSGMCPDHPRYRGDRNPDRRRKPCEACRAIYARRRGPPATEGLAQTPGRCPEDIQRANRAAVVELARKETRLINGHSVEVMVLPSVRCATLGA